MSEGGRIAFLNVTGHKPRALWCRLCDNQDDPTIAAETLDELNYYLLWSHIAVLKALTEREMPFRCQYLLDQETASGFGMLAFLTDADLVAFKMLYPTFRVIPPDLDPADIKTWWFQPR